MMADSIKHSIQRLLDDVDAWFFNYFTYEHFDSDRELLEKLLLLTDESDCCILSNCKNSLVHEYNWPVEYIEQNYDKIISQLKKTGDIFMLNVLNPKLSQTSHKVTMPQPNP